MQHMDANIKHNSSEIQFIRLEELAFDINNPRLPKSINSRDEKSVLEWMLINENITELMESIAEKGFFSGEPLLVIRDENTNKYIVVEGNRRYTASLLLSYPEKASIRTSIVKEIALSASSKPQSLPVLCYSSREEILDYLGYRHITGVEPWDALAKARYLSLLFERLDSSLGIYEKYRILAKQIGSKVPYVRQLLIGKLIFDKIEESNYYSIHNLNDQTFEFGTFYTAIVRPNIAKYVGVDISADDPLKDLNNDHLKDLTKWIFEKNSENQTRLGESRNLGKLDKILDPKHTSALKAFNDGVSLSMAAELTDEADELVVNKLSNAQNLLELAWNYLPKIQNYSVIDLSQLKEMSRTIKMIHDSVKEKLNPESDWI